MKKIYPPARRTYPPEKESWTVEVETGVTIRQLDDFLRRHNPPLAVPSNTVWKVFDMIIDASGTLNTFTHEKNAEEFSAACINLGLLGVIYSYTLRVEPMFNLKMKDTFPLLREFSAQDIKRMVVGDDQTAPNDQTEIFYWPFNSEKLNSIDDRLWVKEWQRTEEPPNESRATVQARKAFQNYETMFGEHLYEYITVHPCCTPFLNYSMFKMIGWKDGSEAVLHAPDAMHYQGGIDNMLCLDLEMAFKVDKDFENVMKAWNYVIEQLYEYANRGEYPFNLTLEMRFVKSSLRLMSNAYDEKDPDAIYCMMEILSVKDTKGFDEFSIKIANYWMTEFGAQPHWAKMWEHVPGIVPYLRTQASERYDRFEAIRKKYDPNGMFMNSTFAGVLGH
ncbi:hypothetical protein BGX34_002527 [Mortierella sp. NVP85]|nr:hypothetical protein BGX34_002527 [Mortierella sp. NVP85]